MSVDTDLIAEIRSRLQLRRPNADAVLSVVNALANHVEGEGTGPFEGIVDSATGVGKTYIMAGLIEYLSAQPTSRNFLVLTPGRTINQKTIENFTRGSRRSLMPSLLSQPKLVTSENFDSAAIRRAIEDTSQTKVYVFTVQSLLLGRADSEQQRKTHEYQEGLGGGFYDVLASLDDLVVLADEHHCYSGPEFSRVIEQLHPYAVIGLTATPLSRDRGKVVYRYPLAAAIAEKYVKTPVIVGRRDDRSDEVTKLADALALIRAKADMSRAYAEEIGAALVNPVLLVSAQDIAEAQRVQKLIESDAFEGGNWIGSTLLVHSELTGDEKERTLAALDNVEAAESPVRIIIQVGMLKEGWDVKNVYAILSLRTSVSEVLTEQTLGRGMRLPYGEYTGIELLDTLEVVAHERYEQLLEKRGILAEEFVATYYRPIIVSNADGESIVEFEEHTVDVNATAGELATPPASVAGGSTEGPGVAVWSWATTTIVDQTTRENEANSAARSSKGRLIQYSPIPDREPITVPQLKVIPRAATTSLTQIADRTQFMLLGISLRDEGRDELKRTLMKGEIDGNVTRIEVHQATSRVGATLFDVPLETTRQDLVRRVLTSPWVSARGVEAIAAQELVDAVIQGMGQEAQQYLSNFFEVAARRLLELIRSQLEPSAGSTVFDDELDMRPLDGIRETRRPQKADTPDLFEPDYAYNGWTKHLYTHAWFDSSPEYHAARAIDEDTGVVTWVRLLRNDSPITWTHSGTSYNPDLVVLERDAAADDTIWFVETKRDSEISSEEVQAKRTAARTWANTATLLMKQQGLSTKCQYLLLAEQDVLDAAGSWPAMKRLGT